MAIHTTLLPNGDVLTWPHAYNYFLATHHASPFTPNIMLWDPFDESVPAHEVADLEHLLLRQHVPP